MNEILWPEFSEYPPKELGVKRRDVWQRMQAGLYLMATTGWSVVQELKAGLAERYGIQPSADSLHRIFRLHLFKAGLIHYQVLPHAIMNGLAMVRLTELGKVRCSNWGWPVVVSDWEKLIHHHNGAGQPRHTAMVLDFAWQARRRGYTAIVAPNMETRSIFPDVYIERGVSEGMYVEVERGRNKLEKWQNYSCLQGFVAVCLLTAMGRRNIIDREILPCNISGLATDLQTLRYAGKCEGNKELWIERW